MRQRLRRVLISDLKYTIIDGAGGTGGPNDTTLVNNKWSNKEGNTATLRITADFTAAPAITEVPEPAALGLLGLGLAGLAAARRRRSRV